MITISSLANQLNESSKLSVDTTDALSIDPTKNMSVLRNTSATVNTVAGGVVQWVAGVIPTGNGIYTTTVFVFSWIPP